MGETISDIVDSELSRAEEVVLNGGLVGKRMANYLLGYNADSNYVYTLGARKRIRRFKFESTVVFSAIDCVCYRINRRKSKIRHLPEENETVKAIAGPRMGV